MAKKSDKPEKAIFSESGGAGEKSGYPTTGDFYGAQKIVVIEKPHAISPVLLEQGFKWLGRWEIIAPFRPYRELAADLVKDRSSAEIEELGIGDPRVPVFDPRLIFIKPNPKTKRIWDRYQKEKENWDPRIAFLSAIWAEKPYVKPLPAGKWIK